MINFWHKHQGWLLTLVILLYGLIFSTLSVVKLQHAGYNALDLAIINQAFFNSAQGDWFHITIHPTNYLGDHFAPVLVLLLPIYYLWQTPELLLILQSFVIGLAVWPLWKIAKLHLSWQWSWAVVALYLLNPVTHNINLFEFHFLPFAIFTLLWTIYFFQLKNWRWFLLWLAVSLIVREDAALVTAMFGIIAALEKRSRKWILLPPIVSLLYFIFALKTISFFAVNGSYKFFYYYSWLGNTFNELLLSPITKLPQILIRFFGIPNIEFILGSLFLLLFLPLLKKTYWWLMVLVYVQFFLGAGGPSGLLLQTHYFSLFYPALLVSAIFGLGVIINKQNHPKIITFLRANKGFGILVLVVGLIYLNITLGPAIGYARAYKQSQPANKIKQLINEIPSQASMMASYGLLSNASSRAELYSLNYAYIGRQQFNAGSYSIPSDVEYLLIDFNDTINLQIQYDNPAFRQYLNQADDNLRQVIDTGNYGVLKLIDTSALLKKDEPNKIELYSIYPAPPEIKELKNQALDSAIVFLGHTTAQIACDEKSCVVPTQLFWQATTSTNNNYELLVKAPACDIEKLYPLGYGIYPTSEWQRGEIIQTNYQFNLEAGQNCLKEISLELVRILNTDKIGSHAREWNSYRLKDFKFERLGEPIYIPLN